MKRSKNDASRSVMPFDHLCINTQTTSAYNELMSSKPEERHRKAVRLAGAQINLNECGAPTLLCSLPDAFPSPGIERSGADAFVSVGGRRVRGDKEMRDALGIRPAIELVREAETTGPAWMWTGLGNVGLNKYCLAWQAGKLYYSVHDEPLLASGWEFDACVWVYSNGWHVRFERVTFVRRGGVWEPLIDGKTVSGVRLIVTGQRLVERGTPIDPTIDANSRHAVSYVDKRHIVLNAYTRLTDRKTRATAVDGRGDPIKRDFGLDQILDKPELLKAAIEGAVVPLRLELQDVDKVSYDVTLEDLTVALLEKDYSKCEDFGELTERRRSGERGLFYIDAAANTCHIVYRRSPYPLHFLAIRKNGDAVLVDAVIGGFSNNAGCTIAGLAGDLRSCGYEEALLLDNGGDAVLVHRRQIDTEGWADANGPSAVVPSSLGRTQWAALMLYQFPTDAGIDVRCDSKGQDGRFCIEWK